MYRDSQHQLSLILFPTSWVYYKLKPHILDTKRIQATGTRADKSLRVACAWNPQPPAAPKRPSGLSCRRTLQQEKSVWRSKRRHAVVQHLYVRVWYSDNYLVEQLNECVYMRETKLPVDLVQWVSFHYILKPSQVALQYNTGQEAGKARNSLVPRTDRRKS